METFQGYPYFLITLMKNKNNLSILCNSNSLKRKKKKEKKNVHFRVDIGFLEKINVSIKVKNGIEM